MILDGGPLVVWNLQRCQEKLGITPGSALPVGGTTGQALVKASNANFDTTWATISGGGLTNLDGGTAASVYGGVTAIDGGGA